MAVHVSIQPTDVFDEQGLIKLLGLRANTLRVARQNREIEYTKKAQRVWYRGDAVLRWLFAPNGCGCTNGRMD